MQQKIIVTIQRLRIFLELTVKIQNTTASVNNNVRAAKSQVKFSSSIFSYINDDIVTISFSLCVHDTYREWAQAKS